MLGNTVGRRGIKRMRWWDGITDSMDMSLRKLHEIVKVKEACFAAIHVITNSQTWLSNWKIPMRTQSPLKALVLVGVEKDLSGRGGLPSSGAGPWIQDKEHEILNVLPNIVFQKHKKCFLQEKELWLSLFSRFYWGIWKGLGAGWVCKNQVTSCCRARLVVDILH